MKITVSNPNWNRFVEKYELKIFPMALSDSEFPVAGENISAAFPTYAENFKTDPVSLDKFHVKRPHTSFIMKLKGKA